MNPRPVSLFAALALVPCVAFAEPSTAVKVQTVRVQKLAETATAYGQLVPNPGAFQWLSAAQSGRIAAVLVTTGTRVKKGQALVRIAATPQTRAAYQTAQSNLAAARAKLKQTRTLYKNELATQSDLAAARSAVANAEASLAALRAEGVGAHAQVIKASTAGVVTRLSVTRGEWVNAGARIAALVPGQALWVRFGLTPEQAARVAPGAPVRVEPVFGAGETFKSRVAKVDAQADPTTGLIDAEVPLAAGESGPFSGEWVAGTITLRNLELPAVARSAVLQDAKGYYVFVVRNDVAHRVDVKPLVRARGLVGLAGIKVGETVVTQGNFELSDGDRVRITDKKDSGS